MKKSKLISIILVGVLMMAILAGCQQTEAVKLTGYYQSSDNVNFFSAYPQYTFKQATFEVQTLETFSDNTYCLTQTSSNYSGSLLFSDDGTFEVVPRGTATYKYYGTYESTVEGAIASVKISSPTAIIANITYATNDIALSYLNTNEWTEDMGLRVGTDGASLTAEEFLKSKTFPEMTILVDTTASTFDFAQLVVTE